MITLLATLLLSFSAQALTFNNDYLSFQLPNDWNCAPSGVNWVCEPKDATLRRMNIVTISAKHAGPSDNLDAFQKYLSNSRTHQMGSDTPVMSQVIKISRRNIAKMPWVHGVHLSSEIKDFYTIYLATVKNGLVIMLTLSSEKSQWPRMQGEFEKMMNSLQVKNFTPPKSAANPGVTLQTGPSAGETAIADQLASPAPPTKGLPKIYVFGLIAAGLILIAAVFIFLKGG